MSIPVLREIRSALRNLNPHEVRQLAEREFAVGVLAGDEEAYRRIVGFLLPENLSARKAQEAGHYVAPIRSEADFSRCDLGLAEPRLPRPPHFYAFDPQNGNRLVDSILDRHVDLWIPLARRFVIFRDPVIERLIRQISRENALFAVATALPDVIPSFVELPWAIGEFASDTAVLTMNQIRLAFLIAAASDASIGYVEQRGQIASIITSAFGWRAIARELVAKIPFGGGLVPKGLVAYAGTYVVGLGLERYLRIGRGLTAEEKREQYKRAYERGRAVVEEIVARFRPARIVS